MQYGGFPATSGALVPPQAAPCPPAPCNTGAPRRRAGMGSRLWAWLTGQKRPREEEQEEQEEGQGQ